MKIFDCNKTFQTKYLCRSIYTPESSPCLFYSYDVCGVDLTAAGS